MTTSNRAQELLDRVADSKFAKDILGPKVITPASNWYEEAVLKRPPSADADSTKNGLIDPIGRAELVGESADGVVSDPHVGAADGLWAAPAVTTADKLAEDQFAEDQVNKSTTKKNRLGKKGKRGPKAADNATEPEPLSTFARVKAGIKEHNLVVVAAGIAFWGLLAIPAVLTAALSIYGMVADPDKVQDQITDNLSGAPEEVQTIIAEQLEGVAGASGGSLAIGAAVGLLLALWTSSGAMAKLMATFNTVWGVSETRSFVKLRGLALAITFGGLLFIGAAAFLLAVMPAVTDAAGMGDTGRVVLNIARFPVLLLVMTIGLAVLYKLGPNRQRPFKIVTLGALVATVLWILMSAAFSIYTASFASYNETYGTLGALVVLLMWLFITAFMVLLGAEFDAADEASAANKPAS